MAVTVKVSVPACCGVPGDSQAAGAAGRHNQAGDGSRMLVRPECGARAAAGGDRLVVGHADRVGRQACGTERDGRVDRDRVVGGCRGPQRVGGRDREGLGPGSRGRAGDRQVAAAGRHSQAGDGVLDIGNDQRIGARAAAGGDRLIVGHVDRVGRQTGGAERDGAD